MWFLLNVLMCMGLILAVWALLEDIAMRKRRRFFRARPVLPVEEWYRVHFPDQSVPRELAVSIGGSLAGILGCDTTQVLPTDRFDWELQNSGILVDSGMESFEEEPMMFLGRPDDWGFVAAAWESGSIRNLLLLCDRTIRYDQTNVPVAVPVVPADR